MHGNYLDQLKENSVLLVKKRIFCVVQVVEYNRLKVEAQKQSARYLQELDSVNREQKAEQDKLDNEARVRADLENKIKQKGHEKDEAQKRVDKLLEHIRYTYTCNKLTEQPLKFVCILNLFTDK